MERDDLKKYSVIIEGGSGCLFQPMTDSYTYILTAKHLFFKEADNGQGKDKVPYQNGTEIVIERFVQCDNGWKKETIPFTLTEGETYFPHKLADIAILKIEDLIEGFDNIGVEDIFKNSDNYQLCGFPSNIRGVTREYTTHNILDFISSNEYFHGARLSGTLRQEDIEGMSGGGILRILNNNISIIGIQSKMGVQKFPAGEIGFVQIKFFKEIIDYDENKEKLSELYPPHLKKFDFLIDDCFSLEVDEIDEFKISSTRKTLRNKAYEITQSDITPLGIKDLFKERLLIDEKESSCLSHKAVWISWLEFLVIMNLMKGENLMKGMLSDLFNSYRLKYLNIDDWTGSFRNTLLESDYIGLKEDSTVVVNTRCAPKSNKYLIIKKGKMPDIANVYDKRGFRTDIGIDPYTSFNFVHLDFFKSKCIIEKLDEYQNLDEIQLIEKIKIEYNELFN
jgi:hypothetical protein